MSNLDMPRVPVSLKNKKNAIVELCKEALKQDFTRGDYRELVEVTLVYLSGGTTFSGFKRPGALHKARWMSKILYCMKLVLLNKKIMQLPKGTVFASQQLTKVRKFVQFVAYCYVPWWLTAPISTSAPRNDLELICSFIEYQKTEPTIGYAALNAMKGHMWYLTEELVPLSLFSSSVTNESKKKMVDKLQLVSFEDVESSTRHGTDFGKPVFPEVPIEHATELSTFIGRNSWIFFRILRLDHSFLNLPVEEWNSSSSYLAAKEVVNNICVVNDAAERGVKLCHDFLDTAKKEANLQNILQVVENARNALPNQRKRKLPTKRWFLTL